MTSTFEWSPEELYRISRTAEDYAGGWPTSGRYPSEQEYDAQITKVREFSAYYLDRELEEDSSYTPGFEHAWARFLDEKVKPLATRSCLCRQGELRPVRGTAFYDWRDDTATCDLACSSTRCKRTDKFQGSSAVRATSEEIRLTVSEAWDTFSRVMHWTVRDRRKVIIRKSVDEEDGRINPDHLRAAIAAHVGVSPESVIFGGKRVPYRELTRIVPRVVTIPAGSVMVDAA